MYASGIPLGLLIDTKGPRWGVFFGAVALASGYFPLWSAYNRGAGSVPFVLLCLSSLLTGMGSCAAFSGAIKVCATNWPQHRGTATAFPLSGFGLSAFAFTMISGFAFPDNPGNYLLMLAIGTFTMVFTGMFFLRMTPPPAPYQSVATEDESRPAFMRKNSNQMTRSSSRHSRHSRHSSKGSMHGEPSKFISAYQPNSFQFKPTDSSNADVDETSSLVSCPGDIPDDKASHHSHKSDITGFALLKNGAFWKLFIMLGLLCGVGLMTIK